MTRAAAVIVLAFLPAMLVAQTSKYGFARGVEIHTDGGSIFRVALPDDVYQTAAQPDLGDVRVLNASGDAVPYTLREARPPARGEPEWQTVPSFPMTDLQTGGPTRTQVKVDANGAVLEVTNGATRQITTAYLVDATTLRAPIARVELSWQTSPSATFLVRVSVQGSDDLDAWRTLVPSAAIAQLQRDDFTLTQNTIDVPVVARAKYLRISWPRELASVTLTAVKVLLPTTPRTVPMHWKTLSAEGVDAAGTASYDARGMFPVESVDVEFADTTDVASITIRSRPSPSSQWRFRHSGLFYTLQESDDRLRSGVAALPRTTDRYWRLETARAGGWTHGKAPRLRIGWHPHEIVFVAQGFPPFTLVYGSARLAAAEAPVDALLARLSESDLETRVRQATLGEPRTLAGTDALIAAPPYRRIALWGVLLAAVGALAFFAFRVFRETDAERSD